jgi:hypothetical protein
MCSKRVVSILAVAVVSVGLAPDPMAGGQGRETQERKKQQRLAESEALRHGGLPAAAAVTGHYEGVISADPENNVETLAQLVAWHDLIVIGHVESNHSWLTADGETIVTDYKIAVERVMKGHTPNRITVSLPGGRVSFPDGSMATLTSTMRPPSTGERYLLFLVPSWFPVSPSEQLAAGGPIYAPQHLSLSVYLIDPSQRVKPRGRLDHLLQKEMATKTEENIIQEIQRLTGRQVGLRGGWSLSGQHPRVVCTAVAAECRSSPM